MNSPCFYLCGVGTRSKLLFRGDALFDARSGERLRHWPGATLRVNAGEWSAELKRGEDIVAHAWEDGVGVYLQEDGQARLLSTDAPGSFAPRFARFEGQPHAEKLRALWHEVAVNIVDGVPLPNLWVYDRAWHRDAAMMALVLERSGDLPLLESWLAGVEDPFDRNNKGNREPDNLGQMLVLLSLLEQPNHPVRDTVLKALPQFTHNAHLTGLTDYNEHPVYATKWLKWGLQKLSLDDPFVIPRVPDSYSSLFWMAFKKQHEPHPRFDAATGALYPYLNWAEAHFYGDAAPPFISDEAPYSWETQASEAHYERLAPLLPELETLRCAAPHTWHAAEMFLFFFDALTPPSTGGL